MVLSVATLTVGCASSDEYRQYAAAQTAAANARSMAEIARYNALAEIAKQGDTAAKVAAVMSLNQGNVLQQPQQPINAPKSIGETALQWTSVLLPSLTQFYGINANRQIAITQSNNAAAVAQSTNATFATMNGNMAKSNTDIANAGFTAVTTVANTGIAQVGTTAAAGLTAVTSVNASSNTAITNVANAANSSVKAIADVIPQLQPNVTTTTTNNNTVAP